MKTRSTMKQSLLCSYLKDHVINIILYVVSVVIFAVVFQLYHLSMQIVVYPSVLCIIVWLLITMVDFTRYSSAHRQRMKLVNHIEVTWENLPNASCLMEKDYQQLLKVVMTHHSHQLSNIEQKFRDMSEYITLWSHQVKTPITAIQLLLQESQEEQVELKEQVVEIERYVDMTLQYMRLDTMSSDLMLKKQSLLSIVKQAIKYHAKSFIGKKTTLDLPDFDTMVVTDEKWLLFVMKQLLSNALQYTQAGTISITVKSNATLVIQDSGIGISGEDIPRIFERGFTGYNGRMDKKSTGIGLFLVKRILDKLSHKISITSELGKGTKVEIDFSNLTKL